METTSFKLKTNLDLTLTLTFFDAEESKSIDLGRAFHVNQVHGCDIYQMQDVDFEKYDGKTLATADGIFIKDSFLSKLTTYCYIKTADCCPLVYVSSQGVALVHAGWRGLALGIHRVLFETGMMRPTETAVYLGPCLHGESFEIGKDVYSRFSQYKNDQNIFRPRERDDRRSFYVWEYLEKEFTQLSVKALHNVRIDTLSDTRFASYRRAMRNKKSLTERNITAILCYRSNLDG